MPNNTETRPIIVKTTKIMNVLVTPITKNISFFFILFALQCSLSLYEGSLFTRLILEIFIDTYIISLFIIILPFKIRPIIKKTIVLFTFSLAILEVILINITGIGISPSILQLALQTNSQEAKEALLNYLSITYIKNIWWILLLIALIIGENTRPTKNFRIFLKKRIPQFVIIFGKTTLCIIIILSSFFSINNKKDICRFLAASNTQFQRLSTSSLITGFYSPFYKTLFAFKAVILANDNLKELEASNTNVIIYNCSPTIPNIVLIIGESYNKAHSQLYGYKLQTTPNQLRHERDGELIAFTNVVTPWNYTYEALIHMFSTYSICDSKDWYNYPFFPTLFKKAGYYVTFWTNQFAESLAKNRWDFSAGVIFNTPIMSEAMFNCRNNTMCQYDLDFVNNYSSSSLNEHNYNFNIFHLYGQHIDYQQRYPSDLKRIFENMYNRPDLTEDQLHILCDYDNATRYNDDVLEAIIALYKNKNAIIVFCPDHGEQVFDGNLEFGRTQKINISSVQQQFEIPFWIWGSEQFRKQNPSLWHRLLSVKDFAFMTDNLAQLLLSLGNINSPYYTEKNDILNPAYNESRIRLLRGKYDYNNYQ